MLKPWLGVNVGWVGAKLKIGAVGGQDVVDVGFGVVWDLVGGNMVDWHQTIQMLRDDPGSLGSLEEMDGSADFVVESTSQRH